MGTYSIKDLEKLSRVKAHTIRIWEKRYGLLRPDRTTTNIREYSDDDLRRLLNVALLNDHGLKISRIAKLSEAEMKARILAMEDTAGAGPDIVESLIAATLAFDGVRFERLLAGAVLRLGFERCMFEVMIPFMQRVGVLWQVGAMKPGQEHFVTNLLRQKVIAAIDGCEPVQKEPAMRVLMFLPEGELHEIGILFGHYLLKCAGHEVLYLGQTLPQADLFEVIARRPTDVLVTSVSSHSGLVDLMQLADELHKTAPELRIMIHARSAPTVDPETPVTFLADLRDLVARVERRR
ncbi:MAG: MerR family transcriptional regulator [Flavobacteriales bacterium]|nr:MerR family transcriptional regulator [Flavobacteriales bacterium]HPF90925.1 MerR family transcriptional regulator [Flavobacteriales bacterium]